MATESKCTAAQAVAVLRSKVGNESLISDSYLDADVLAAAERFVNSAEFAETLELLGPLRDKIVLDVGAGRGIASLGFARAGAKIVYALEPDPDDDVGRGAIEKLINGFDIHVIDAFGERIPLESASVDIVYARQLLHHARDVERLIAECSRLLKPGGRFFACREHVADNEDQLSRFLERHPVHQLAGGENAYPISRYISALTSGGLEIQSVLGPWDSIVNAFPSVRSVRELDQLGNALLRKRFGAASSLISRLPGVHALVWKRIRAYKEPGRLYSFLAIKPATRSST
jgi:ubiquinone/menaquinone biosynthesis C-methylase UbiE